MLAWAELDSTPMRLLVHMALVANDPAQARTVEPCLYYAGWEAQARALGERDIPSPAATDTYSVARRHYLANRTTKVRATLLAVGAIESVKRGTPGHAAVYRVCTEQTPMVGADRHPPWVSHRHP